MHLLISFWKGDIIRAENIYYDLNKYAIRQAAAIEPDKMDEVMWKYLTCILSCGHIPTAGLPRPLNMTLSSHRAEAVVQYLLTKGIAPSRMRAAGYGESVPVNKCVDGVSVQKKSISRIGGPNSKCFQ